MKLITALSILTLAATAASRSIDKDALEKDLFELLELRPVEEISELYLNYIKKDDEFQNYARYGMSEEYKNVFAAVQKTPEAREWLNFLDQSGVKAYEYLNSLNDGLGIDHLVPDENSTLTLIDKDIAITGGLLGLVADIAKFTPFDKIEELHEEKLKTSSLYAYFIERVGSHEFEILSTNLIFTDEFLRLMQSMRAANIDVVAAKKLQCVTLGIRNC